MNTLKTKQETDAAWLKIVLQQIGSLHYGVVQIIVHDGRVTQIERTERVRLDKQPLTYEI
ncbi:MAG: YezD family protein [Verrucomicrobia bacterium]|nr:YezD family protein [Verrucomicrobiota bacterium]